MTLEFRVHHWHVGASDDPLEAETQASLEIVANGVSLTEVDDRLAHTVRPHINVPVGALARWLIVNWWRLRWEPAPDESQNPSDDWCMSHMLPGISGDDVWPPLTIASDGEFVRLLMRPVERDSCAVRFMRPGVFDIPATEFERAVDAFLETTGSRVAARLPEHRDLSELVDELVLERRSPVAAFECRLQARAGIDPGSDPEWLLEAKRLATEFGRHAFEEVVPAAPDMKTAKATLDAMRNSTTKVRFGGITLPEPEKKARPRELPWERGARIAQRLRVANGLGTGPVSPEAFGDLFGVKLPLPVNVPCSPVSLKGGYRHDSASAAFSSVLVTSKIKKAQRFYLARLLAAHVTAAPSDRVLPVTTAGTAFQKAQRSFAQEFLCPWSALDEFTRENGVGDDAISEAAEYFLVSDRVITSTLANHGRIARDRVMGWFP